MPLADTVRDEPGTVPHPDYLDDEGHYPLNGTLIKVNNECSYAVATDGRRLAECKAPPDNLCQHDVSIILPARASEVLLNLLVNKNEAVLASWS